MQHMFLGLHNYFCTHPDIQGLKQVFYRICGVARKGFVGKKMKANFFDFYMQHDCEMKCGKLRAGI